MLLVSPQTEYRDDGHDGQERKEENRRKQIEPMREDEARGVGDRCHGLRFAVLEELARLDDGVMERND